MPAKAVAVLLLAMPLLADGPGRIRSLYTRKDFALTADPAAAPWRNVPPVIADNDQHGKPQPGHRTEIRSRWSGRNIYFLFVCPYEALYLKPNPSTATETNKLWEWDVAEVFAGSDFSNIRRYKEFQVSPQGEWVDLDIDRDKPNAAAEGWLWNSGIQVKARIDEAKKIWYGEMQIPLAAIDARPPSAGNELRINFYRLQGPAPRKYVAWQPTHANSYHVPEAFGRLVLAKD